MLSPPCLGEPCDILRLLEKSNVVPLHNEQSDDYWEFLGPPNYDSSRPCSIKFKLWGLKDSIEQVHDPFQVEQALIIHPKSNEEDL